MVAVLANLTRGVWLIAQEIKEIEDSDFFKVALPLFCNNFKVKFFSTFENGLMAFFYGQVSSTLLMRTISHLTILCLSVVAFNRRKFQVLLSLLYKVVL